MEHRESEALRAGYRALEEEARDYADPVTAMSRARRRRTGLAAAGAALTVTAVLAGVGLQHQPWAASVSPAVAVTTTPFVIRPPANAAPLPEHGTGAAGLLVYTTCMHGCPTYLVLTDGRQHLVGEQTPPPPGNLTLSPDGRWLGRPTASGYELQDLIDGTVHEITSPRPTEPGLVLSPWAWSAGGRLLLGYHASGDVRSYVEVDLADGRTTTPAVPQGFEPVGTLPSGVSLLTDRSRYGERATRLDLAVGEPGRRITLDGGSTALITEDGGPTIQVRGDRVHAVAPELTAVIVFDTEGDEVARLPLRPGDTPLGPVEGGYAVQAGSAIQLRTPSGSRLLYDVPENALVVLPGTARH